MSVCYTLTFFLHPPPVIFWRESRLNLAPSLLCTHGKFLTFSPCQSHGNARADQPPTHDKKRRQRGKKKAHTDTKPHKGTEINDK